MSIDMYSFERELMSRGITPVCGVDEAGCGPLAGPVCAAAVILNPDDCIDGLNDSKKLTDETRRTLFEQIKSRALSWSVASVGEKDIDSINILQARLLAMRTAVDALALTPKHALIDGDRDPSLAIDSLLIKKGDSLSASIAAASIVAKVTRDNWMCEAAKLYPQYRFEKHMGYGTKLHYQMLDSFGPCEIHRQSFLVKWRAK